MLAAVVLRINLLTGLRVEQHDGSGRARACGCLEGFDVPAAEIFRDVAVEGEVGGCGVDAVAVRDAGGLVDLDMQCHAASLMARRAFLSSPGWLKSTTAASLPSRTYVRSRPCAPRGSPTRWMRTPCWSDQTSGGSCGRAGRPSMARAASAPWMAAAPPGGGPVGAPG